MPYQGFRLGLATALLGILATGCGQKPQALHPISLSHPAPAPRHKTPEGPSVPRAYANFDMLSSSVGWVMTPSAILRTIDGARQWTVVHRFTASQQNPLRSFYFTDTEQGWTLDGTNVLRTTDGGQTWTKGALPSGSARDFGGFQPSGVIDGVDTEFAWLASAGAQFGKVRVSAHIFDTFDGGGHWSLAYPPASKGSALAGSPAFHGGWVTSLSFDSPSTGWATVDNVPGAPGGTCLLYETTNGGETWTQATMAYPKELEAAQYSMCVEAPRFFGTGNGVALVVFGSLKSAPVVHDFVYTTSNGGRSWTPIASPTLSPLGTVAYLSPSTWLLQTEGTVWVTTTAGSSWKHITLTVPLGGTTGSFGIYHGPLEFVSLNTWFYFPWTDDAVWMTTDGGETWTSTTMQVTNPAEGTLGPSSVTP